VPHPRGLATAMSAKRWPRSTERCQFILRGGLSCGRPAVARIDYRDRSGYVCAAHRDVLPWWRA
jgi:hypothetical protein